MASDERGVQAWTILTYAAHHRQKVSADILGRLIRVPADDLAPVLESIDRYCRDKELPVLTSIVSGWPPGVSAEPDAGLRAARDAVYRHEWLYTPAPAPADLEEPE